MSRALILNASFEPLCVVSTRRALMLVLDEKAELLHGTGHHFHAERIAIPEPSVVRLAYYVKVPYQARIALNRRAVFARDGHRCQYCGSAAENIDHIIPRSKGGPHAWDNVVAACRPCNTREAGPDARRDGHEAAKEAHHAPGTQLDPGGQRHRAAGLGAVSRRLLGDVVRLTL